MATNNPLVSVIVPCYKQAHYLGEALASVQAQTLSDWECIIVNDGSPDNTAEVARQWMARDSRFRYIEKQNGGLSSARNRGLAETRGAFIQFLDADDAIKPTKFEQQLQAASNINALTLVYCDYYHAAENNLQCELPKYYLTPRFFTQDPLSELILGWESNISIPIHCYLLDARFFSDKQIQFDESLPNHEDFDLAINMLSLRPVVMYVDAKLAVYRVHGHSMCRDRRKMRDGFIIAIEKGQKVFREFPEIIKDLRKKKKTCLRSYPDCTNLGRIKKSLALYRGLLCSIIKRRLPFVWKVLKRLKNEINQPTEVS